MRIITWNINGFRAITGKGAFDEFLERYQPDILLLQETKGKADVLAPFFDPYRLDYEIFHNPAEKAGYSGTAIFAKRSLANSSTESSPPLGGTEGGLLIKNIKFIPNLPNYDCNEGRVCRVDFSAEPLPLRGGVEGGVENSKHSQQYSILGVYFPNGGKSPEAWEEKLKFYNAFLEYVNELRNQGKTVIWGGDVNCCHTAIDIARPEANDGKVGFHPRERAWIDRCIERGWSDIWRSKNPDTLDQYSWWTYRGGARDKNVGWRIDYLFADQSMLDDVKKIEYFNEQMGSDHCPLAIDINL